MQLPEAGVTAQGDIQGDLALPITLHSPPITTILLVDLVGMVEGEVGVVVEMAVVPLVVGADAVPPEVVVEMAVVPLVVGAAVDPPAMEAMGTVVVVGAEDLELVMEEDLGDHRLHRAHPSHQVHPGHLTMILAATIAVHPDIATGAWDGQVTIVPIDPPLDPTVPIITLIIPIITTMITMHGYLT